MNSKIAQALKMKLSPVAVIYSGEAPEEAIQFKPGVWGCITSLIYASAKGSTAALSSETTSCPGGRVGAGFDNFKPGIEFFLSNGGERGGKAEHYKKTAELARDYIRAVPEVEKPEFLVLKPLDRLESGEKPEIVIFMVDADQLSGLCTLANFDSPRQDNVRLEFGAGCVQALLYPMSENYSETKKCVIGLTDPSSRKHIPSGLLSFSIPYSRFLEMEENVEQSFLSTDTWRAIANSSFSC